MKKTLIATILGVSFVAASYGQGLIHFSNYYSPSQTSGVTYGDGSAAGLGVGSEITVQLLYGASTATAIDQLTALNYVNGGNMSPVAAGLGLASAPGAIGTGAGWFDGGAVLIPGTAGSTYAFALMATGTYNGQTYTGYSGIFYGATQASSSVGIPELPSGLQQGSFTVITPVPEPATLALAGLGGFGVLLALRRKKS